MLLAVAHHLIVDGWSLGIFCRELSHYYRPGLTEPAADLPVLRRHPADYAARQCERLTSERMQRCETYWRSHLASAPAPVLAHSGAVHGGARIDCSVASGLCRDLVRMCRQLRTTPFNVMLAAFAVSLTKTFETAAHTIAIDFSDRTTHGDEDIIGMFVNQLPLCITAMSGPASALIAEVQRIVHAALQHKDMPYALIRRATASVDGRAAAADFQVKFVLHNFPCAALELRDLEVRILEVTASQPKFPVLLEFWQHEDHLQGTLVYDRCFLDAQRGQRMIDEFLHTLRTVVDDPLTELAFEPRTAKRRRFESRPVPIQRCADAQLQAGGHAPGSPAVFTASREGVALSEWITVSRPQLNEQLLSHGAVLLRGFQIGTAANFAQAVSHIGGAAIEYTERTTPRRQLLPGVYTSTEYPSDQEIFFHNENAYASSFPTHLYFWCETPPASDGYTPLADCRRVLSELPHEIVEAFERRGVYYRRTFRAGLGVPWQQAFGVANRSELEDRYTPAGYCFEWHDAELVASLRTPAVTVHPTSGQRSWFNHAALFHRAALAPALRTALRTLGDERLQVESFFGDGDPIPDVWIERIRATYRAQSSHFAWRADDLLVVDNRTLAHGRTPFTPPRRINVAMTGTATHCACAQSTRIREQ
jgi:alpha-ketoglutarate-dependent taurine dioxygenase